MKRVNKSESEKGLVKNMRVGGRERGRKVDRMRKYRVFF